MIYLFLADGFEEVEALTPLDILRRAEIPVCTVGIGGNYPVGAHKICVKADLVDTDVDLSDMTGVILPGGMPGTINLGNSLMVQSALEKAMEKNLPIAAICAAPSILGRAGYLNGRRATCFPGFEEDLHGAILSDTPVITDGNIITARGAGVALEFALALTSLLKSKDKAEEIRSGIQCR